MKIIPWRLRYVLMCLLNIRDLSSAIGFATSIDLPVTFSARLRFLWQIYVISLYVDCAHTQDEILTVAAALLTIPTTVEGVFVEAGCFKGGSTAKLSLVCRMVNRRLIAFDSFEGLPDNSDSNQQTLSGETPNFSRGKYLGTLQEVEKTVRRYGDSDRCTFVKGWFSDTMPQFTEAVVAGYIDVDLASSTKTCLKYLFPKLQPGGSLFSQDGHLPLVIAVIDDDEFWKSEVGCRKPATQGLHTKKLVRITR